MNFKIQFVLKIGVSLIITAALSSCKKSYICTCSAATQTNGFNTFSDVYYIKERKEKKAIESCAAKSRNYDNIVGTQQSYGTVLFVSCSIK